MEVDNTHDAVSIREAIIPCTNTSHFIILVPSGGFYFAGSFQFQCLHGEITVAGYTQQGAPFNAERFVPFTTHNKAQVPLCFKPQAQSSIRDTDLDFIARVSCIIEGGDSALYKRASHYAAALVVSVKPSMVERFLLSRIENFTKPLDKYKSVNVAGDCYIVIGVKNQSIIMALPDYIADLHTVESAISYVQASGYSLMVTGPTRVGKSTMTRYIVNRFLSSNKKVYLLDTDVGQTEFTLPGCLSLVRLTQPILTPTFLHQSKMLHDTICLGTTSPGGCIDVYVQTAQQLFERYYALHDADSVLVVNTHGWVDGQGYDIMRKLLRVMRPTTVLNMIARSTRSFEMPQLDVEQHHFKYISEPRINDSTAKEITPRTWREYATTGYFAHCLGDAHFGEPNPLRTLANVLCYQVAFSSVALHLHRDRPYVKDHLILSAINCGIVAMCTFRSPQERASVRRRRMNNDPALPQMITSPVAARSLALRCLGFGFIRGISIERRMFYIVSPMSPELSTSVEVLVVPNALYTPVFMLDRETADDAPYIVKTRTDAEYASLIQSQHRVIDALQAKLTNTTGHRSAARLVGARPQNSAPQPLMRHMQ